MGPQLPVTQAPGLPTFLNILTILAYVGSGLRVFGALLTAALAPFLERMLVFQKEMMEDMSRQSGMRMNTAGMFDLHEALIRTLIDHRWIYVVAMTAGAALCAYGAYRMRSLRDSGFWIYTAGHAASLLFWILFWNPIMLISTAMFPLVFIILFATQRKQLVN